MKNDTCTYDEEKNFDTLKRAIVFRLTHIMVVSYLWHIYKRDGKNWTIWTMH